MYTLQRKPGPRELVEIGYQMIKLQNQNMNQNLNPDPANSEDSGMKRSASGPKIHFNRGELKILEEYFQGTTHPNADRREVIAKELNVDEKRIKNWFQNRRTKAKNQEKAEKAIEVLQLGHLNPYPQPVHPQVHPQVQPEVMRFNTGLGAAMNSFGHSGPMHLLQGNPNPYPQLVHPQVPLVQPAVMGFNPGLGPAINNFGLNFPLRPTIPMQLPGLTHCTQGNPNPFATVDPNSILDNVYKENKFPGDIRMQELAGQLNVSFNIVKIWFEDRRRLERTKENKT